MYWDGTTEEDRVLADEWFLFNMKELIANNGKQWRWLIIMRNISAEMYYFIVSKFGKKEFDRKQRVKEERRKLLSSMQEKGDSLKAV